MRWDSLVEYSDAGWLYLYHINVAKIVKPQIMSMFVLWSFSLIVNRKRGKYELMPDDASYRLCYDSITSRWYPRPKITGGARGILPDGTSPRVFVSFRLPSPSEPSSTHKSLALKPRDSDHEHSSNVYADYLSF